MSSLVSHLPKGTEVLRANDGHGSIFELVKNFGSLLAIVIAEDLEKGDSGEVDCGQVVEKARELGVPKIVVVGSNGFVGDFEKYTGPRLRGIDYVVRYVLAGVQSNL